MNNSIAKEVTILTETQNYTMNDIINKRVETIKRGYFIDPNRILQDFRKETAEIQGYHGRELLELLQNAVDEIDAAKYRYVCIELSDNRLRLCPWCQAHLTFDLTYCVESCCIDEHGPVL